MASPMNQQSQMGASNTPSCISAIRDAYKSGTKPPASSAPPARTHTAVHLQACTSSSLNTLHACPTALRHAFTYPDISIPLITLSNACVTTVRHACAHLAIASGNNTLSQSAR